MNTVELIKQAATQNIHGVNAMKSYLQKIGKQINSSKMIDICNEIYNQYLTFKQDKDQFNELSLFLNIEIEKSI